MLAIRQVYDNPPERITVPAELRHRRAEVLFIAMDEDQPTPINKKQVLASLARVISQFENSQEFLREKIYFL